MIDDCTAREGPESSDAERDPALRQILEEWRLPPATEKLDARVLASYRQLMKTKTWWRRFFAGSISVPVPVAAAILALLLVSAALALRPWGGARIPAAKSSVSGSLQASHVEQPVIIHTSLSGFEPVAEVNVSVVPEHRR
jgi:hypothetical protein